MLDVRVCSGQEDLTAESLADGESDVSVSVEDSDVSNSVVCASSSQCTVANHDMSS